MRSTAVAAIDPNRRLRMVPALARLSEMERRAIVRTMDVEVIQPGVTFHQSDDYARFVFSGAVKIVHRRGAIALLGMGILPRLPLSPGGLAFETLYKSTIAEVPWKRLEAVVPEAYRRIREESYRSSSEVLDRIILRNARFFRLSLRHRLALLLLELAADFGLRDSRGLFLPLHVTQGLIGQMIGASRPRVNEELAVMEGEKLLVRRGWRLIVKADAIRAMLAASPNSRFAVSAPISSPYIPSSSLYVAPRRSGSLGGRLIGSPTGSAAEGVHRRR